MLILLGHLLVGVATVLSSLLTLFIFLLFIRAIVSWFSPDPSNPLVIFLNGVTEPLLTPIKRKIPPIGMFDLSVIIAILGLYLLEHFLVGSMMSFGEVFVSTGQNMLRDGLNTL